VVKFNALAPNLAVGIWESAKILSGYAVFWTRFEPRPAGTQSRRVAQLDALTIEKQMSQVQSSKFAVGPRQ
jgi:hypothetical protein